MKELNILFITAGTTESPSGLDWIDYAHTAGDLLENSLPEKTDKASHNQKMQPASGAIDTKAKGKDCPSCDTFKQKNPKTGKDNYYYNDSNGETFSYPEGKKPARAQEIRTQ